MKLPSMKKPNPYARKITLTIRVDSEEMRAILKNAAAFTGGNVSELLRYASVNFKVKK